MEVIIIILVVIVALVCAYIGLLNALNVAKVKIDEASSDIDVALTKRYDVLTKMIDVVKGYTKYEQETIFKTIELRRNMSISEKNEASKAMDENVAKIHELAENYPELKASENYNTLQKAIADVEEHLQAARRFYNANVSAYNQKLVTFPSSLVAGMNGFTKKEFFEAEAAKRSDVKMDF